MSLSSFYGKSTPAISYELFPPKTDKGEIALYKHVECLIKFKPSFVTCTYGAGGSTQTKTLDICREVKSRFDVPVASHLTVVESTVDQLRSYLDSAKEAGIDYIVALRGDPPQGQDTFVQKEGGLQYANELVQLIREEYTNFDVIVAGYPEKHQEAPSREVDLVNLKRKVEAGADVVVCQLFYDNDDFFRFRDECDKLSINVPIVPGILPVTNLNQIQRITALCGSELPTSFVSRLGEKEDTDWQFKVGVEYATEQVQQLLEEQVSGIHFYVLNKSAATSNVMESIRLP